MIFFIADTHFGHSRIRSYSDRLFNSVKDMDDTIIENINLKVKKKDVLYFIGDFCNKGGDPKNYLNNIYCKNIHLVIGNHDNLEKVTGLFQTITHINEIIYCNQRIVMCHYPLRSWNKSYKSSWMLYGHVHGRLNHKDVTSNLLTLDVGVDNKREGVGFGSPWSFKDIQKEFASRQKNSRAGVDKSIL